MSDFGAKYFGSKDFGSKDFGSRDFGSKPFGSDAVAQAIAGRIDDSMRSAAKASPGSFLAKVVSSSNGYYTLTTPDGRVLRRINSQTRNAWPEDAYVTVDVTSEGSTAITGPGAAQSE